MTAESVSRALRGRRSGRGYVASCPAHEDRSPSLSIRDVGGKVLVHCFSGCPQEAVIAALRARGAWPERQQADWTPDQRAEWGRQRRTLERDLPDAARWQCAAVRMIEELLCVLKATFFDPTAQDRPSSAELQRLTAMLGRLNGATDAALVAEYQWWTEHYPGLTWGMVDAVKRREAAEARAVKRYLKSVVPGRCA